MNDQPLTVSLDYETFYSKEYSIRDLGNYGYTHHPEFNAYLLTAATEDGDTWGGNPKEFDYPAVDGAIWIMANAGFDVSVTERLIELGDVPSVRPVAVYDVLDLARYLGYPGNLAGATEAMLGVKLDKGVRDSAKGKHWEDMTPDQQSEMMRYARRDAIYTLEIWKKYQHLWPEWEREVSRLTREMCSRGLPVDLDGIDKDIENLETLLWKVRTQIPWAEDPDAVVLSKKQVAIECRKHDVLPPKSMAKDSEEFEEWLRVHGDNFKWARAMGSYRSINGQMKKLRAMRARCKDHGDGTGTMIYGLKYAGAHTLRDSGDMGVNVQNFARKPMFEEEMRELLGIWPEKFDNGEFVMNPRDHYGIDMRGKIMAPDGYVLGVVDLSAIEPCVLNTLADDREMVDLLKQGMDPYEAQGRVDGSYTDPRPLKDVDPDLRQHKKVDVLGMGYGAGPEKIQVIAKQMVGLDLTLEQARTAVFKFRSRRFIPNLWNDLEQGMRSCAGGDYTIELPSGRVMLYRDVKDYGTLSAVIPRTGKMMRLKFWGGTLAENVTQAAARDVFMDRVLALAEYGLPPILRVHDEAVCLLGEETAETDLKAMLRIFSTPPAWWQDLPVRADGHLCKRYTKG
jgi:hypothetical protein